MNYKKEVTQRQKEKAAAAAATATTTATTTATVKRAPITGEVEKAANESEAKIFAVLDAMGIAHVGVSGEDE